MRTNEQKRRKKSIILDECAETFKHTKNQKQIIPHQHLTSNLIFLHGVIHILKTVQIYFTLTLSDKESALRSQETYACFVSEF
jgi:hypothetical protein